jgi:hypothetical protein
MGMEEPHAHMRESMESISTFSCFGLFFPFLIHQLSPYPDASFLRLPFLMCAIFRESSSLSDQSSAPGTLRAIPSRSRNNRMSMGERHEHWGTSCEYENHMRI